MALALSDMSRESLVRELRMAKARGDREREARVKRELAKRGSVNAIAAQASTAQTRKWWDHD